MLHRLTLLVFVLCLFGKVAAQTVATGYAVTTSFNTNYTTYSGGTVYGNPNTDNNAFNAISIGFPFVYNATSYNTISINPNGFIAMGNTVSAAGTGVAYVNSNDRSGIALASATGTNNIIAGFNMDLQNRLGGELSTQLVGTAPGRIFIVQWKNFRKFGVTADTFNFQIQLHEQANLIKVHYGNQVYSPISNPFYAQVGLRGASNADFNVRTASSGWLVTSSGTSNTSNLLVSTASLPIPNQEFTWAPGGISKDLAVSKLLNPTTTGCLFGAAEHVMAVVQNRGSNPIDTFVAGFRYQGTVFLDTFYLTQSLNYGFSDTVQFQPTLNLSSPGSYPIDVFVFQPGEAALNRANDTLKTTVVSMSPVSSYPYSELFNSTTSLPLGWRSFEETGSGWYADGPSFNLALTSSLIITTQQGDGAMVFDSYLPANTGKHSALVSPCLNFSAITSDSLLLEVSYLQGSTFLAYPDSIGVRLSTDGGISYPHGLARLIRPNAQAANPQWSLATIDLSAFKGAPLCKLSFTGYGADGYKVAMDYIKIRTANTIISTNDKITNQPGSLFPNPTNHSFSFSDNQPSEITLFSMSGTRITQKHLLPNEAMNVADLPPGLYQVVRRMGEVTHRVKLIKN